jgi:7-cyano-7-deazaguanine synthase in queuosine biosynthesis
MTNIFVHDDATKLPRPSGDEIPVLIYGGSPPANGTGSIGHQVRERLRRLQHPVPNAAYDLLTVSLAVTAADTFASRDLAADGWVRDLHLSIAVNDVSAWKAVRQQLQQALRFLSGDNWTIQFLAGGPEPPAPLKRGWRTELDPCDCVSLFSGGLDSSIGAINLQTIGRTPIFVSHSYPRDGQRQEWIRARLPKTAFNFSASAHPASKLETPNDVQMRTRSLNFIAFGSAIAATMAELKRSPIKLYVPENGFISLNPPLTARRIGALSTRTTHPHFISMIQTILDRLAIPVAIENPFADKTKGEMIANCKNPRVLKAVAAETVSCGKWKRSGEQCGKCVPCIIRRAAFHAAGQRDPTLYRASGFDLGRVLEGNSGKDDVLAMILAARKYSRKNVAGWVLNSGPLGAEGSKRAALVNVALRGISEVKEFLKSKSLI